MSRRLLLLFAVAALGMVVSPVHGQADYKRYFDEDNLPKVREIFRIGRYDLVLQVCDYALRRGQPSWEWRTLRMQSLSRMGRYDEAAEEGAAIAKTFPDSLGALLEVHAFLDRTGRHEKAGELLDGINSAASELGKKDDPEPLEQVFLGQAALLLGAEPKLVLERYFGPPKRLEAKGQNIPEGLVEAHVASGELALEKSDFALAADEYRAALKYDPENPDLHFGLAQAFLPNNRQRGMELLDRVLRDAPVHFGALLLKAEYAINYEQYEEAKRYLDLIHSINPGQPEAYAYRAVIAHLERNDDALLETVRRRALEAWGDNPEVDHLIGRVLSRQYRFAEGAESQRRALAFDPGYLPAKLQLALDYLRLGELDKAWPLAREAGEQDPYNVLAYNLEVLEEEIDSFTEIRTPHFSIRMPEDEAALYGDRALAILEEAREVLEAKYGLSIDRPVQVEFFPDQQDFAIRSFGSLGGAGLLGVCFGSVVTMNSPGSLAHGKNNWEATLWHEYCHVITLTATKNKMPRWLSEGISVYEEKQKNPRWGQHMTPRYRTMILEEDALTPVGEMSQAFFRAESGEELMFAYYQSMLVVEYMVETHGMEALRGILTDLGEGVLINDALARHTGDLAAFQEDFTEFARGLALGLAPDVDWSKPEPDEVNPASSLAVAAFLKKNPKNFWARRTLTEKFLAQEMWDKAIESAGELIALHPLYVESGNGYQLKARAFRGKGDEEGEAAALEEWASRSAEAYPAYTRLIDLHFESENWQAVKENAGRALAINPFLQQVHYCRGCAAEALGREGDAVRSFEKALELNPANPSEVRYRLAGLLREIDPERSRRYLLDSLADSPRYRDAHRRLLAFREEPVPGESEEPEATVGPKGSPGEDAESEAVR